MDRKIPSGWINLGRSVLINLVAPSLLLGMVAPHFAHDSAAPLLVCALIPIADLLFMFARRRVVDTVAIISITQLSVGIAITLVTGNVKLALTLHALQAAALGLVFAASTLIGRPLMRSLARQSMAGDDRALQAQFDSRTATPQVQCRFAVMSWIWAIVLCAQSAAMVLASRMMSPAAYLMLHNFVGYGVLGLLIWGSIRYGRAKAQSAATDGTP